MNASGARISRDGLYRYTLWRRWNIGNILHFILLNPSTATATTDDATIRVCCARARNLGYGAILVTNLFAFRSTDPQALYDAVDPVGPSNDRAIVGAARRTSRTICAWGNHGLFMQRDKEVLFLLSSAGVPPYMLARNQNGTPAHPLYLSMDLKPVPYVRGPCGKID